MKAIVVRQPWATLIALGVKTIETRPCPPNGPMRPEGVRGLPGLAIERGERIAIVAGRDKADVGKVGLAPWEPLMDPASPGRLRERMALGAVIATVVVVDAVQVTTRGRSFIDSYEDEGVLPHQRGELWLIGTKNPTGGTPTRIGEQAPYGDFTPGRWGWLLTDPKRTDPIPCKGKQGVFALPADVAEQIPC